jgi:hypothetical protein
MNSPCLMRLDVAVSIQQVQVKRQAQPAGNRAQREGSLRLPTGLLEAIGEGLDRIID